MSIDEIRRIIHSRAMNSTQITVVALCVVINMLDGFDILAASFVAPVITREFGLGPEALGILFAAGPAGMTAGAFFLSPVADLYGRRTALVMCLSLMSVGMIFSSLANSVALLVVLRFVTGLGVGAMASCTGTMVVEFSSTKRKDLGLGWVTVGYPIGAVVGGAVAVWLINAFSWRAVFIFGGCASALMIPIVLKGMPESLDFLLSRRPGNALARINQVLKRLELGPIEALPPGQAETGAGEQGGLSDLLRQPLLPRTVAMSLTYFLYMMSSYFILNWATTLTTETGASDAAGISVSILINLGGIAGGLAVGFLSVALGLSRVTMSVVLLLGLSIVAFGLLGENLALVSLASPLIGFGIFGAAVGLYATAASVFPARVRATGIGFSMGAGRFGSFCGPYLTGLILAGGVDRIGVCVIMALPAILAAFMVTRVWYVSRLPHVEAPI